MIQLTAAGKRYGDRVLFDKLDWLINLKDRAGLVGANGTGKSTLLKVIGGMESLDMGSLTVMRGLTVGYLPQDGLNLAGRTVFDECMTVFASIDRIERELEELSGKLSDLDHTSPEYDLIADRFHHLQTELSTKDAYTREAQVGSVLDGLSFRKEDWTRRTEEFSGGWQMRIALAKLLLQQPNILLLDEPTNHLDIEARNWLEQYLREYPFAFVLISHDRYFLDVTINKIVEIWNKGVHFYSGNYDKYVQQKNDRRTQLESAYKNQRDRVEQLEAFINRFRAQATKAKQVQSRIKELEKIERIEVPPEERTIHFRFPQPKPSGRIVAEFTGVSKSYGPKNVISKVNFVIEKGDRVALCGVNGAGKSTLIKLLAGAEPLTSGEYKLGHNVDADYFAQDQYKELDPNATLLYDLTGITQRSTQTELRSLLGCFLFSEDDVFKKIGVLSGGERNRYALAKLLLQPSNFLLLDEPTNHLDMRAKDVLLNSLEEYTGTIVFVSHDRYFIDKLATRIFEIEDGEVRVYPGNYEDYMWRKTGAGDPTLFRIGHGEAASGTGTNGAGVSLAATTAPGKRLNPQKLKQLESKVKSLEDRIAAAESEIAVHEAELADYKSPEESLRISALIESRRKELETNIAEWELASQQLAETNA